MKALLIALMLVAGPLSADETADRRAAAEAYINSPVQQKLLDSMLSPEAVVVQLRASLPPDVAQSLNEEQMAQMATIASEELDGMRPTMEKAMIEAAVEVFTIAEIEAMNEFYSTPEGASVAEKMPPFMQVFYTGIGGDMQAAQMRIVRRINEFMTQN